MKKIIPDKVVHDILCSIVFSEGPDIEFVQVISKYYEPLIDFLRQNRFQWDSSQKVWRMNINVTTGGAKDRAVEIGNKLLNAGYIVQVDEIIQQRVIDADYEPRYERWVSAFPRKEKFYIQWEYGADQVYKDASKLPKAQYRHGGLEVPVSSWESVLEFAETYNFRISPGAEKMIEEYKDKVIVAKPKQPKKVEYSDNKKEIEDILNSSRDVLEDLKEDN